MSWLTPELEEFHHAAKSEYRATLRDESNIETAQGYIREYSNYQFSSEEAATTGHRHPIDGEVEQLGAESDIDVFYRCFPYQNQPFMLVTNNPGFVDPYSYLKTGEGLLYNQLASTDRGLDVEQMARIGGHYISSWLRGTHITNLFEELAEGIDGDSARDLQLGKREKLDVDEYLQTRTVRYWKHFAREAVLSGGDEWRWEELDPQAELDLSTGFFNDFYYTTAYKFSTPDSGGTKNFDTSIEHDLCAEIEAADPEILFTAGSMPWKTIYDQYELTEVDDSTHCRKITEAARGVFEVTSDASPDYVVALKHPSIGGKYHIAVERLCSVEDL